MPNLREFRDRIKSVKSTKKITSAMKMVAASKLRRAQRQAESAQPYAQAMAAMLARVCAQFSEEKEGAPKLVAGTGNDDRHLLIIVTADRGLCGGFNPNVIKYTLLCIAALEAEGKDVRLITIGRKGHEALRRVHKEKIVHYFDDIMGNNNIEYSMADRVTQMVLSKFDVEAFDVCTLVYNRFKSVLVQKPGEVQLIPLDLEQSGATERGTGKIEDVGVRFDQETGYFYPYSYEPSQDEILSTLLPRNVGMQIYRGLLESAVGEQAARMTSMDNATRNAGDMINDLVSRYNRARQAYITKELIEIIAGAEAV
ncbi:MAG: F0F1 ATP synthase subunit gamma [Alphaproteobacteria bacterium]